MSHHYLHEEFITDLDVLTRENCFPTKPRSADLADSKVGGMLMKRVRM